MIQELEFPHRILVLVPWCEIKRKFFIRLTVTKGSNSEEEQKGEDCALPFHVQGKKKKNTSAFLEQVNIFGAGLAPGAASRRCISL